MQHRTHGDPKCFLGKQMDATGGGVSWEGEGERGAEREMEKEERAGEKVKRRNNRMPKENELNRKGRLKIIVNI